MGFGYVDLFCYLDLFRGWLPWFMVCTYQGLVPSSITCIYPAFDGTLGWES